MEDILCRPDFQKIYGGLTLQIIEAGKEINCKISRETSLNPKYAMFSHKFYDEIQTTFSHEKLSITCS
jgi:hypothetical protein